MDITHVGYVAIITPSGPVWENETVAELEQAIRELLERGNRNLVLDLSQTSYLNSTALGVIIAGQSNYRRRGGGVKLCGVNEKILQVIAVTKGPLEFDLYDTKDEAMASFERESLMSANARDVVPSLDLSEALAKSIDLDERTREVPAFMRPVREPVSSSSRNESPKLIDDVQFGVATPSMMVPGTTSVVDVWAFAEPWRSAVWTRIKEEGEGAIDFKTRGPVRVPRGSRLGIRLRIDGLIVKGERDGSFSMIWWDGSVGNASFQVEVPSDHVEGPVPGEAIITLHGFQLARLFFTANIGLTRGKTVLSAVSERRYRTAFASYSSKDRRRVLARVHGLQKAGIEVFLDVVGLRSGAKYEAELLGMIESRDVFYLFWSRAASESKWVDYEWRTALKKRGLDYIDPFPLESPETAPPPAELGGTLHFNDWILAYLDCQPAARWWQFWKRNEAAGA